MNKIVLVIGTTPDYVQWIRQSCPGRALFITAPEIRQAAAEDCPAAHEEILVTLSDPALVLDAVKRHVKEWDQVIDGIFCFDCEAMVLTALIAKELGLDYPSLRTIQNCQDKYVSKQIWKDHGVECPRTSPVKTVSDVLAFLKTIDSGCVLKPFIGSGSELVFKCLNKSDCQSAFKTMQKELKNRAQVPLFKKSASNEYLMLAEELINGTEYSCDVIIENTTIHIIRMAKKIKSPYKPFGTIMGYVLPASLPHGIDQDHFHELLFNSATVLGIKRGLCMVDFIISDNRVVLIELTPRPGGDCLPYLLKACSKLDILSLSLDFAQNCPLTFNTHGWGSVHVGIRLHADKNGILKNIDHSLLLEDKRVKNILLTKKPGHQIILPPKDYDSWFLGHVIIEPSSEKYPESQAMTISKKINVVIESNKAKGS